MLRRSVFVCLMLVLALMLGACGDPGTSPVAPDNNAVSGETVNKSATERAAAGPETPAPPAAPDGKHPTTTNPAEPTRPTAGEAPAPGTTPPVSAPRPQAPPKPVAPADSAVDTTAVTLSVDCRTVLANREDLNPEKAELIPADGVILPARAVEFKAGENVFNVLQREMKRGKIHLEFVATPAYDSAYIKGIHNLYEGDCGPLSGWTYKVNGQLPNFGCSQYMLQPGDVVEIVYSCDLGRDVGGATGS